MNIKIICLGKIKEHSLLDLIDEYKKRISKYANIEIVELAKIVNDFFDFKSKIIVKKDGLNKEYTGDNSTLLKLMPDLKFTSYAEGMKKFYSLMKNQSQVL